jgi:transcriptional regulator with XRE-family HTH domain
MSNDDQQPRRPRRKFDVAFGGRMRQERERQGLTQGSLVGSLILMHDIDWFHQTTVGKVESGDRPIRLEEAVAIADLLGVGLEELTHGQEDAVVRSQRIERALAVLAEVQQNIARQMAALRAEAAQVQGDDIEGQDA